MLRELHIQNLAIIQDLLLDFSPGLVVFTGETGAGKSIILDAISTVIGGRVDGTLVRKGSDRAIVEAVFEFDEHAILVLQPLLEHEGLWEGTPQVTLAREIRLEGRNIARVNGRSVSVSLQSEIGSVLVDLHGQSEHLSLLKVRYHIDLLDRFAHNAELLNEYKATYTAWSARNREIRSLWEMEKTSRDRADMLRYQIQEIETAKINLDEEDGLRQERTRLANAEALSVLTRQALALIDEGDGESAPATDLLGQAAHSLSELGRIDEQMQEVAERANEALSGLSDIAYELRSYGEAIEFNPTRLDQIEERINALNLLKRKYGGTLASVLEHLDNARVELEKVGNVESEIEQLNTEIIRLKEQLSALAGSLSVGRKAAAGELENGIETQLNRLQMVNAKFKVSFNHSHDFEGLSIEGERVAFDSTGVDKVEFLVETNVGEGFKPLVRIASGGETSRLMLALKHVLAKADQVDTLIFDEIDSGIGGRVGATVGGMLWQLSREHQVMCVTHLPQLAAYGDQHFHVTKQELDQRTYTKVEELFGDERVAELASMIGSKSSGTLSSAAEILDSVAQFTGKI